MGYILRYPSRAFRKTAAPPDSDTLNYTRSIYAPFSKPRPARGRALKRAGGGLSTVARPKGHRLYFCP